MNENMDKDIKKIIISEDALKSRICEIGAELRNDYKDKNPLVICVLKGGVLFLSDLIRAMNIPLEIDFMATSSYGSGMKSSGVVKIIKDLDISIEGRDLIIVEDILDTGLTLDYIIRTLEERGPKSVKVCCLLLKECVPKVEVKTDYLGFKVPDEFVVGYGLDYAGFYRNLPYIGVLKEEVYMK